MKVAIVTPYYTESDDILNRCHLSVLAQNYPNVTHIMVADGRPAAWCNNQKIEHFILPHSHRDAGATPRAIAAISAFSRGYNAVGFLDADNWIDADHVSTMVNLLQDQYAVAVAQRRIHALDTRLLYVDNWESNGRDFADTNCLFLTKPVLHLMTRWVTDASQNLWSDREFWNAIIQSKLPIVCCDRPTVAYVTRWAAHYVSARVEPPADSVWIHYEPDGSLTHIKHSNTKEYKK